MKVSCEICGKNFNTHLEYANHKRWKHIDNTESNLKNKQTHINYYNNLLGEKKDYEKNCLKCGNKFVIKNVRDRQAKRVFCSKSCASAFRGSTAKYFTKEVRENISKKSKQSWKEGKHDNVTQLKYFSSKGERGILKYLQQNFPQDNWTTGGLLHFEQCTIQRDIYSNRLKICIEYDGIWHFKDIRGGLENKQMKDRMLNKWCLLNGYTIIRISESFWQKDYLNKRYEKLCKILEVVIKNKNKLLFLGKEYFKQTKSQLL